MGREQNRANQRKHGVAFEEARDRLRDENARRVSDPDHQSAKTAITPVGLSIRLRLLVVCHSFRESERIIRIIAVEKQTHRNDVTTPGGYHEKRYDFRVEPIPIEQTQAPDIDSTRHRYGPILQESVPAVRHSVSEPALTCICGIARLKEAAQARLGFVTANNALERSVKGLAMGAAGARTNVAPAARWPRSRAAAQRGR